MQHAREARLGITRMAGAAAVSLALLAVLFDAVTPVQANVAIVYGLPLVAAVMTRRRGLLWGLAALLSCAAFVVYWAELPGSGPAPGFFLVNRMLAVAALLLTAALLHLRIVALDRMEAQRRLLSERKEELEAAYRRIADQNRELESRRQQAEDDSGRKSRLLASVSHDLRTPLSTISLVAEAIRRSAQDPSLALNVPALAGRLQANARNIGELITGVLDAAQLESGRIECHESRFSLNELVAEQCAAHAPLAEQKNLRLAAELHEELWLCIDRVMLGRVLSNLLGNAIKFTAAGGVSVSVRRMPSGLVLRVRDTGVGIPAECQKCIFEEFSQVHRQGGSREKGWGLGLAISRRLVALMGGTLSVESEPQRGSVFNVALPERCLIDPALEQRSATECA